MLARVTTEHAYRTAAARAPIEATVAPRVSLGVLVLIAGAYGAILALARDLDVARVKCTRNEPKANSCEAWEFHGGRAHFRRVPLDFGRVVVEQDPNDAARGRLVMRSDTDGDWPCTDRTHLGLDVQRDLARRLAHAMEGPGSFEERASWGDFTLHPFQASLVVAVAGAAAAALRRRYRFVIDPDADALVIRRVSPWGTRVVGRTSLAGARSVTHDTARTLTLTLDDGARSIEVPERLKPRDAARLSAAVEEYLARSRGSAS